MLLAVSALAISSPASALGSLSNNGNGSFTASNLAANDIVFICATNVAANVCGVGQNNFSYSTSQNGTYWAGSTVSIPGSGTGPMNAGTYNISIVDVTGPTLIASTSNVSVIAGGGSSSSSSTAPTAPAPVFQQFGKPATGTCADAASATLNWAGVTSGGWGESWAQWMNSGKGGAVCSRSLVYSLGLSKWILG